MWNPFLDWHFDQPVSDDVALAYLAVMAVSYAAVVATLIMEHDLPAVWSNEHTLSPRDSPDAPRHLWRRYAQNLQHFPIMRAILRLDTSA